MPKHPDYCSIERVRFCYDKSTNEVQGRIKLVGKTLSAGITTDIRCTLNEFTKAHASKSDTIGLQRKLIKWERSIYRIACMLTEINQPVTVTRLVEVLGLIPDGFPALEDNEATAVSFHFKIADEPSVLDGLREITTQFRIGNRIALVQLDTGIRCSQQDWQVLSELRTTPESERLSAQLTAYQKAILYTAQVFQGVGADLNPAVVHTAAMGPYGNGPYVNKDFYRYG